MPEPTIADDLLQLLNWEQKHGRKTVYLAPDTRSQFFPDSVQACRETRDANPAPASRSTEPRVTGAGLKTDTSAATIQQAKQDSSDHGGDPMTCGWEDLSRLVQTCHRCSLHKSRTNVVFGEGDPHARIMFIGEGPGFDEDQSGRPFVGRAGQLLTKMIQAMQLSREEVFIGNIVKCRPPGNRTPHEDEAEACLPFLRRQIELIQPDILVLLGATPLKYILGKTGITRLHGTWHDVNGIATIPTFHPSYLLRSPQRKRDVWEDLKKVMARIGKDPEETMRKVRRQD